LHNSIIVFEGMKKVLLFVLLFVAVSAVQILHGEIQFSSYMQKFNKNYKNGEEYVMRLKNFEDSIQRIEKLNKKAKYARFGINKFSDMSVEEFQNTILMKNPIIPTQKPNVPVLQTNVAALPTSFGWRDKGAVTAVKDQGQCGSCWAFSVTENVESMWILAGKAKNNTLNLAPQQIVDCDTSDAGCEGGDPPTAYEYIISAGGLEGTKDYPYTAQDGNCNFNKSEIVAKISTWNYATSFYSESELQTNLVGWGPLSVCVDASNWQDYQSGVMTWEECAYVNVLDHCVQLVGYQTQTSKGDFWMVRNSWGTDWGINGYIYLEMGSDTCGIAHEATSSVV